MSTLPDSLHDEILRPTWVEIDLAAFSRNLDVVRRMLPEGSRLIAVLKANGYGHGAVELARRCERCPVAMIAVALLEEAVELRRAGIDLPLLCFGALGDAALRRAVEYDVIPG